MTEKKPHISIVSPVYMGEKMVSELVRRIKESVETITENFDIILVNDASPDASWEAIEQACANDKRVKGINLSRNFGQHYAITAGLNYAQGDWVVVMDCDLQDRPEEIPNLYKKAQEGWEIVYAKRTDRQDGFFKKWSSAVFHRLYHYLSGVKSDRTIANFGIYHSKVIGEYNKIKEVARSFTTLIYQLGFKSVSVCVNHSIRMEGKTSYSFRKLINLTLDIVLANSNKPLKMTVKLGFVLSFLSLLLALYNVLAKAFGIIQLVGYTTLVFSIWFVGGLILFVLGIIGLYIGKIFDQVKGRQLFIVREKINF